MRARSRELGQNFLVDPNLLGVIERLAELDPDDVVLEVGGGAGVLSEHLAPRVGWLHVVEVDPRLQARLRDLLGRFDNVTLLIGDALEVDLGALAPEPTKLVANLPYGVAATVLLRVIERLAGVGLLVAMVQREVGERFAASPGGRDYGIPSVLAQLECDVRVARSVSRTVFRPVPNVDSVLVVMRRARPGAGEDLRRLVHGAFAHRRKALASSVALFDGGGAARRDALRAALERIGAPADVRAEKLSPDQFRALAAELEP